MNSRILLLCLTLAFSVAGAKTQAQQASDVQNMDGANIGHLPLVFEPNVGQADSGVRFLSRTSAYAVYLEGNKVALVLPSAKRGDRRDSRSSRTVTMELLQANATASAIGADLLPGVSNYFIGKQPADWHTGVPQFGKVLFKSIYPGTDLEYYGKAGELEYDFILAPGADAKSLIFQITGVNKLDLDASGNLSLGVDDKSLILKKPVIYQEENGSRRVIAGDFVLRGNDEVGIALGDYDRSKSLVVDPVLSYSTLIGADNNTQLQGIAVDAKEDVYVTGTTFATDYPVVKAFQRTNNGYTDIFVTKLGPGGSQILYSTYLGGSSFDNAAAIAVDGEGSAYVTGTVGSADFPTTPGAFMTNCPGICNTPFVTKILTNGSLAFSTLMGGSNSPAHAIAVDSLGEAFITGNTASADLPTTPGSFEPNFAGLECTSCYNAYVEKLNAAGTALEYSTYFGASGFGGVPSTIGTGIALDAGGNAYVVGSTSVIPTLNPLEGGPATGFLAKFTPDGSKLVYSTYLGGSGVDSPVGVAVDPFGNAHVAGNSQSCDFPLSLTSFNTTCVNQSYEQRVFALTVNATGTGILFSTFLDDGTANGIVVDQIGNSYVTGSTGSSSFPLLNAIETNLQRSVANAVVNTFITELDLSGKLLFSTYLGGQGGSQPAGIAVNGNAGVYVAGTGNGDFPLLKPIPSQLKVSSNYQIFVAKILPTNTHQFSLSPRASPLLSLRNVSSLPLTISGITTSTNFTQGGNCGSNLAPGSECTLILNGAADNLTSGTVTITSNAYKTPQTFAISKSSFGGGVGLLLKIAPDAVEFDPQLIGTTSPAKQLVIQNIGLLPAAINRIFIPSPGAFNQTNDCPAMLNPNNFCTISVTYTSTGTQPEPGQIAILHDPDQSQDTVFLGGSGSASAILASTTNVQFGNQFVGAAPLTRVVNFANTTPYPANVTGLSTSLGFAQTNTCSAPLPPHAACRVALTYTPVTNEDAAGTLTASGFGPGGAQKVSLYAHGLILSALSASPVPLELNGFVGQPATGVVTLTNTSQVPLKLLGFQVAGPVSQTHKCSVWLAVGASCTMNVTFTSTQGGVSTGSIAVQHSGQGSPQVVTVVATAQTILSVSPSLLDFGQEKLRAKALNSPSIGNGTPFPAVTVTSVTVQGTGFKIVSNPCGTVFPPFIGCVGPEISFIPTTTGLHTGTLTVVASDSSTPHVVNLQGVGISNGQGTLSAVSFDFGTQAVGTLSQPQKVTLENNGTGPLKLGSITASQQFAETSTCAATLAAKASCTISVRFAPTLQGILVGSLMVQDDGSGNPHTVTLNGVGQ